jgi:2-aminoadipate transaminase
MRLNFSGSSEEEIREGVRRIGGVLAEQVDLYKTITREQPIVEPEAPPGDVVPLPPRRQES